jgi:hypothetical protein
MPANQDQLLPDEFLDPNQSITSLNGRFTFIYQSDGNLVLYRNRDGKALWASNTFGQSAGRCFMQADGNLVIYDPSGAPVWATNTAVQSR